jgi:hypothetical protein
MELNLTLRDLREMAKSLGIKNYSRLKKHELLYVLEMYFALQKGTPIDTERRRANAMERYYKGIYD